MSVDVATIGETMILLVPGSDAAPEAVSTFHRHIGGAESNVAITLSRLGATTSWHSALGDDAFGKHIQQSISAGGVQCYIRSDHTRATGLYIKEMGSTGTTVRYYRNNSAASHLIPTDIDGLIGARPKLIHTTGITPALSTGNHELIDNLWHDHRETALKSFDINFRPALHSNDHAERLRRLGNASTIVFCGDDEAHQLWGIDSIPQIRAALDGPEVLVIKHGADGATVLSRHGHHFVPAQNVDVVEVVGAGDALAAGFLFGITRDFHPEKCLQIGTELAARAVQVKDDLPEVERPLVPNKD